MGQQASHELVDDSIPSRTLKSRTIESVAELIKDGKVSRIVVLTGAGVSTSAGIPDFRSPKTGLYANLARLNLPYAEAVFDISYFRQNPYPFYTLARELYPGKYKPTVAHVFIALLAEKGLLHMLFTQNIDCLERAAGVPTENIVEAHGSFATQRCIECHTAFPDNLMLSAVQNGDVPQCIVPQCNGLVKPDIVFFGEALPDSFGQNRPKIMQADLVIIMGTSLTVQPFASLPEFAQEDVPRLLINLERVGGLGSRADDVCILSECDAGVRRLADVLEWRDELETLWKEVLGKEADGDVKEAKPDTKTRDEILEDEIETLTREVDQTLKLSAGHKQHLEDHLNAKILKGPSEVSAISSTGGEKDQAEASRRPAIVGENTTSAKVSMERNLIATEETKTEQKYTGEFGRDDEQKLGEANDPGKSNSVDDTKSYL